MSDCLNSIIAKGITAAGGDGSQRIRPQYLIVALVIVGEGEVGGRHLVLLRPSAAHSAIGKISISEAPPPRAAPRRDATAHADRARLV